MLPVQALLREVPVRAAARVGARLPPAHDAGPRRAQGSRAPGQGAGHRPGPGPDRRAGPGLGRGGAGWSTGPSARRARWPRQVMEKTVGMAAERLLPPYARQRFTTWFRASATAGNRPPCSAPGGPSEVVGVPDLLRRVHGSRRRPRPSSRSTSTTAWRARCPRAPGAAVPRGCTRATSRSSPRRPGATSPRWPPRCGPGADVIVAQPTCAYVVKRTTRSTPAGPDADLGGRAHLRPGRVPRARGTRREDDPRARHRFPGRDDGRVPDKVTYHVACHLQAQHIGLQEPRPAQAGRGEGHTRAAVLGHRRDLGLPGRELRTGPPGGGTPGPRDQAAGNEVVCGDCHLANGAILQETGRRPVHPMQLMARAYGVDRRRRTVTEPAAAATLGADPGRRARPARLRAGAGRLPGTGHRPQAHRRVALGPIMTLVFENRHRAVPGPGDGPGREDHQRRRRSSPSSTSTTACCRPPASCRPPVHRADLRGVAAQVAAPAGRDRAAGRASSSGLTW